MQLAHGDIAHLARAVLPRLTIVFATPRLPIRYPDLTLNNVWNPRLAKMRWALVCQPMTHRFDRNESRKSRRSQN